MGTIMAEVAVLLIHMDKNHVGSIMPRTNLWWEMSAIDIYIYDMH